MEKKQSFLLNLSCYRSSIKIEVNNIKNMDLGNIFFSLNHIENYAITWQSSQYYLEFCHSLTKF